MRRNATLRQSLDKAVRLGLPTGQTTLAEPEPSRQGAELWGKRWSLGQASLVCLLVPDATDFSTAAPQICALPISFALRGQESASARIASPVRGKAFLFHIKWGRGRARRQRIELSEEGALVLPMYSGDANETSQGA